MDVRYRIASKADEEGVVSLWTALQREQAETDARFRPALDAELRWRNDYREWVEARVRRIVVADSDTQLVGFVSAGLWRPAAVYEQVLETYVDDIYVIPACRNRGIGSALLGAIRTWSRTVGAPNVRLGVLAVNKAGLRFWEKQGAQPFTTTMLLSDV